MLLFTPDTITIKRLVTGAKDQYGNVTKSWQDITTVQGQVQPNSTNENNQASGQNVQTTYKVFLPAGVDVQPSDRFGWNGLTFEVDGDPDYWPGHTEAIALVYRGA